MEILVIVQDLIQWCLFCEEGVGGEPFCHLSSHRAVCVSFSGCLPLCIWLHFYAEYHVLAELRGGTKHRAWPPPYSLDLSSCSSYFSHLILILLFLVYSFLNCDKKQEDWKPCCIWHLQGTGSHYCWISMLPSPLKSCAILHELLNFSVPIKWV